MPDELVKQLFPQKCGAILSAKDVECLVFAEILTEHLEKLH